MTSKVLHTVPPGYPVAVLSRQADWLLVEDYRERKGWVFASLVKEPKTVLIKASKGNLRSGPSLDDGIIVQLDHEKIMPLLERSGEWLKVTDFEGLTGWLHQKDIWPSVVMNK
jgi:SH3-like domain-containing protein